MYLLYYTVHKIIHTIRSRILSQITDSLKRVSKRKMGREIKITKQIEIKELLDGKGTNEMHRNAANNKPQGDKNTKQG